jgi:uncharacterized membrane protein YhhN
MKIPMPMKPKIIATVYFLIGITYTLINTQMSFGLAVALKGMIIPILILFYMFSVRRNINIPVLAALLLSWAGDVLIDFSFIPGLACFLFSQIMYIIVFTRVPGKSVIFYSRLYFLIPVVLYGCALISILYKNLDGMRVPVILYAVVILSMIVAALNRMHRVSRLSYILVLSGAILFVISDSLISISKFYYPFRYSGIAIMTTYILAQYLIINGIVKQGDFRT